MRISDILTGLTLYAAGDTIASIILGEFQLSRMFGMMLVGGGLYALEIPAYFRWIDSIGARPLTRGLFAAAYFNPLWIARHLMFIRIFSGKPIDWDLLSIGVTSFIYAAPVTLLANFLIQGVIPLRGRFFASASFSVTMAVYYALATRLFA